MSRTDVHRPWNVQTADPHNRHLLRIYGSWRGEPLVTSFRNLSCGCTLCTGQPGRKRARRQERHLTRRALHEAAGQYAADDLDEDAPRPFRPTTW
jgi:hypothetical protein